MNEATARSPRAAPRSAARARLSPPRARAAGARGRRSCKRLIRWGRQREHRRGGRGGWKRPSQRRRQRGCLDSRFILSARKTETLRGSEEFVPAQRFVLVLVQVLVDALESVARAVLLANCRREAENLIGASVTPSQRLDEFAARHLPVPVRIQRVEHVGQLRSERR